MSSGYVPGFKTEDLSSTTGAYITLDEHQPYGQLHGEDESPSSQDNLLYALNKLGYVTIQEEGPKTTIYAGVPLHYLHSRTVRLTDRVGTAKSTGHSRDYTSGFDCYPSPTFGQCSIPPLIETDDASFRVTGIVQDETHAKVNILIPWKLTQIGTELKPFAADVRAREDKLDLGKSNYHAYPALYSWEHLLNERSQSGESPAVILFQKFDDGWRIVNEDGKSEKDFQ